MKTVLRWQRVKEVRLKLDRGMWMAAAALAGVLQAGDSSAAEAVANRAADAAGVTADAAKAAEQAQRQQYAEILKAEADKAQERVQGYTQRLQELDKDIEARIDRIIKLLASIKDSTDSRGRVRRSKDKAIEGLKKSIAYYVRERDKRSQAVVTPAGATPAAEDLTKEVGVLNKRIDKRIDQISSLASSMTQNEEFNRYERYRNNDYDYSTETKEFRRFQKDVSASAETKAELIKNLKAGIDKQTREIAALKETLLTTTDEKRKNVIQEEIESKEEIVATRRDEIENLLSAEAPQAKPVSSKGAFEIDKLLADMTLDLQSDFRKFQQLVSERSEAQVRARYSQERLQQFGVAP
jgi:chromosome segregation ATPase